MYCCTCHIDWNDLSTSCIERFVWRSFSKSLCPSICPSLCHTWHLFSVKISTHSYTVRKHYWRIVFLMPLFLSLLSIRPNRLTYSLNLVICLFTRKCGIYPHSLLSTTVWSISTVTFHDDVAQKVMKIAEFWKLSLKASGLASYDDKSPGLFKKMYSPKFVMS